MTIGRRRPGDLGDQVEEEDRRSGGSGAALADHAGNDLLSRRLHLDMTGRGPLTGLDRAFANDTNDHSSKYDSPQ